VPNSSGAEIQSVKIYENILAFQAAQFEFSALSAGQLKVGSFLPDFNGQNWRRECHKCSERRSQKSVSSERHEKPPSQEFDKVAFYVVKSE
jgi:hypothetical protein